REKEGDEEKEREGERERGKRERGREERERGIEREKERERGRKREKKRGREIEREGERERERGRERGRGREELSCKRSGRKSRPQWENKMEHITTHLHIPRTTRSPLSFWGDGGIIPFEPFFFMLFPEVWRKLKSNEMCLFIYLLTQNGSSYFTKTCHGKEERGNMHTWRAQYNGELYSAFEKDESLPKRNLLILSQLVGP
ncbi:hypothetical protein Tco_0201074, partial [Tanacetum coccineum]